MPRQPRPRPDRTSSRRASCACSPAVTASDPGELLELRYRLGDGQRMGQLFEPAARARGLATRALALGRRTDVYVGCAPRVRRHGGRRAIERGYVLWADCDGEQRGRGAAMRSSRRRRS